MRNVAEIVTRSVSSNAIQKASRRACDSLFYLKFGQDNLRQYLQRIYIATVLEQVFLDWSTSQRLRIQTQSPTAFLNREQFPLMLENRRCHVQCIQLDDPTTHPLKQAAHLPLAPFISPSFGEHSIFVFASMTSASSDRNLAIYPILSRTWRRQKLAPITITSAEPTSIMLFGQTTDARKRIETATVSAEHATAIESDFAGLAALQCATPLPHELSIYSTALDDTLTIDHSDWLTLGSASDQVTFWGWLSRAELRNKSVLVKEKKQRVVPLLSLRGIEELVG